MTIFDVLSLIGGLALFLFGMNIMGESLERRAGNGLRDLLGKMTGNKISGLLTGLGVTAIIQSSSATTVMVVGFVNSGLMTLKQSVNVIMGANIGTTITAWILSLTGIDSSNVFVMLLKPTSFTPILALIGITLYMLSKNDKKKDLGTILLGFATLMFGMDTMAASVSGLQNVDQFRQLFILFTNPVLGVLAGLTLTAIIQSSSASVGILQALASTGQVTYGAAVPIIMGQNIGTCITALISSIGANKNAKRAAMVHLCFNIIGTAVWLTVFCILKAILMPLILNESATLAGIAVVHSIFNILCTILLIPFSNTLEKIVCKLIPDSKSNENETKLDERLLITPALAIEQCRKTAVEMAILSTRALKNSIKSVTNYSKEIAKNIREDEENCDLYEDMLGTYLVKLSSQNLSGPGNEEVTELLKVIGDFERISDHAVNILESSEELRNKKLTLSENALREFELISSAINEILDLSMTAFRDNDITTASLVEPLEQVVDKLKEQLRTRHILRMQSGICSIEVGFVWSDLLTSIERTSDHCSNIAGCIIDTAQHNLDLHKTLRGIKNNDDRFNKNFEKFANKYSLRKNN